MRHKFNNKSIWFFLIVFAIAVMAGGCGGDASLVSGLRDTGESTAAPDPNQKAVSLYQFGDHPTIGDALALGPKGEFVRASNQTAQLDLSSLAFGEVLQSRAQTGMVRAAVPNKNDILNTRLPKRNINTYPTAYLSIASGPAADGDEASPPDSSVAARASEFYLVYPGTEIQEDMSIYKAREYETHTRNYRLRNPTPTPCTKMEISLHNQFPAGVELEIEAPNGGVGSIPANGGLGEFKIHFHITDPDILGIGMYEIVSTWTPWSPDGRGVGGEVRITLNIMETTYEVEFFERGTVAYKEELDPTLYQNLIGDVTDYKNTGYKNQWGEPLTEEMIAQIPDGFRKVGLAADGNTRLIMRVTSYLDTPIQIFGITFPFVESFGFRAEALDGSLIVEDNAEWGVVRAVDVGDNVYQATFVIVAPDTFRKDLFAFPLQELMLGVDHVSWSTAHEEYRHEDLGAHFMDLAMPPVVLLGGLWGDYRYVWGKPGNPNANGISYINSEYGGGPWQAKVCLDWTGRGGINTWTAEADRFPLHLRERFKHYNHRALACTGADVLAYSMGGTFAYHFASANPQNKSDPMSYKNGMLHRIVTVGTPYLGSNWANWTLGNTSRFHTDYRNNPLTNWMVVSRDEILAEIQTVGRFKEWNTDVFSFAQDRSNNFSRENIIEGLHLAEYGGPLNEQLRSLGHSVPSYSVSSLGNVPLRAFMLQRPSSEPFVDKLLAGLRSKGYDTSHINTIGDMDLSLGAYQAALVPEYYLLGARDPAKGFLTIYTFVTMRKVPVGAKTRDLIAVMDMLFGPNQEHDTIVSNASSKWIFGNAWAGENQAGHIGYLNHAQLTTTVDFALYIDKFLSPREELADFSTEQRGFAAASLPADVAVQSSPEARSLVSQMMESSYQPPETITLNVPSGNQVSRSAIPISGTVPPEVPDGSLIRIEITGVDEPSILMLPDVVQSGGFSYQLYLQEPGAYHVQISYGTEYDGSLIVSPMKEIFVEPPLLRPFRIFQFLEQDILLKVGEEIEINSLTLNCMNKNFLQFSMTDPRYGTNYRIENSQYARISDGKIVGVREGRTRLIATYVAHTAYLDIEVYDEN